MQGVTNKFCSLDASVMAMVTHVIRLLVRSVTAEIIPRVTYPVRRPALARIRHKNAGVINVLSARIYTWATRETVTNVTKQSI